MPICQDQSGTDQHKSEGTCDRLGKGPAVFEKFIQP